MSYTNQYEADNRRARAIQDADEMTEHLQAWADARRGWKFHDSTEGNWTCWAGRAFHYPRHSWIRLTVRFSPARRADWPPRPNQWLAELTPAFSAGPEDQELGTFEQVEEWVRGREKMLALPLQLAECKALEYATLVVGQAPRSHIGMLGLLFDYTAHDLDVIRRKLVRDFCPAACTSPYL